MRVRSYAVILLLVAGILPMLVFGYLSIAKSKSTTVAAARRTNQMLSESAAERISEYLRHEARQLITAGTGMLLAPPEEAHHLGEAYLIDNPHWRNLSVVNAQGAVVVEVPSTDFERPAASTTQALAGKATFSEVREAKTGRGGPFAHSVAAALPLYVVGSLRGAVLVDVDLISIWAPIDAITIGQRGFARLVTADGTVLAHGNAADREDVFAGQKQHELLEAAKRGENIKNSRGEIAITAIHAVDGMDWFVIIEQPVGEAFAPAQAMEKSLLALIALTALSSIIVGLWAGRGLVRSLETMEAHTRTLASGDLSVSFEIQSPVSEVKSLVVSINTMASSLDSLHEEARLRERITTFGRVAAGLAHDLRLPIETIQEATHVILANPGDSDAIDHFRWAATNELPKLREYLDDLKHLASGGEVGLHRTKVNLGDLMEQLREALSSLPKWEGIEFRVAGTARDMKLDAKLLRRAIYNLAANGADAIVRQGRGTVTLEVQELSGRTGDELVIRIRDDGHGMTNESLAMVLAGDFCSTKRANGVGLGFGVARYIVQSHGGTITGTSEEGSGTTFEMHFPRVV